MTPRSDLPYTTGSLLVQYGKAWRTIAKLSLPNKYLSGTADDARETRSEKMFAGLAPASPGPFLERPSSRVQDRDGDGAAVAAA